MTEEDRARWDERHAGAAPTGEPGLPEIFVPYADLFPRTGRAIDVACGTGQASVWLALRGMTVWGLDVSTVAIDRARLLADREDVLDRCRFDVVDLDRGMPDGPPVDLILCHKFRDARLDRPMINRLRDGGMLAIAVLSEVDAGPGSFRVPPGELRRAFAELGVVADAERHGEAWLLARRGSKSEETPSS